MEIRFFGRALKKCVEDGGCDWFVHLHVADYAGISIDALRKECCGRMPRSVSRPGPPVASPPGAGQEPQRDLLVLPLGKPLVGSGRSQHYRHAYRQQPVWAATC